MARKILLADDSVTAQNMGRKILMEAGYEVITVNNGSAALKKIAEQKPDLIVLDVYMPGYGGLEVCQRLKENEETSRIPVLLTVGKLEPFKAEEARRVRADMHIVKPFEANELLTALAKLEERIVAQSDAPKVGRFAKAEAPPEADFGDEQGGWKSRLTMPRRKSKSADPNSESKSETAQETRLAPPLPPKVEAAKSQVVPVKPKRRSSRFEEATPEMTPEEVAAIVSAASAFRDEELPKQSVAVAVPEETKEQTDIPVVPPIAEPAPALQAQRLEALPTVSVVEPVVETTAQSSLASEPSGGEAEVDAALAFLIPSNGSANHGSGTEAEPQSSNSHAGHATAHAQFSGPRWIAQATAVSDEESNSILEREMENAYAALAAADAGRMSFAMGPLEALKFSSQEVRATGANVSEASEQQAPDEDGPAVASSSDPEPERKSLVASETASPQTDLRVPVSSEHIAEPGNFVEPEAPPPALEVAVLQAAPVPSAEPGVIWLSSPTSFREAATEPPPVVKRDEPSALAAAASAGATEATVKRVEVEEKSLSSDTKGAALVAEWQSWRRIREEGTKEPDKAIGDRGDAKEMEDSAPPDLSAIAARTDAATSQGDADEISSMVDTMLAELKPKLMKEIAKKMAKEKK